MSAGAEADPLVRITEVGPALEIFAFEPGDVDQHLLCGRPASQPGARQSLLNLLLKDRAWLDPPDIVCVFEST